ncbi:hypothetical protein ALC62_09925 [Cyphomyrmex costatus]|uniref:DDE Tnp4 domain-containing protein n=1 Tax=Cyphomyrmex costatus TaxID=456900 RepID=A0A151IET3_9HYME|nr:hypothetical protein ALC62_09925 [Cyphomyrmex costatus]
MQVGAGYSAGLRWREIETAIESRILTGSVINSRHIQPRQFLEDASEIVLERVRDIIFSIAYYVHCSYDSSLSGYRFRRDNNCIAWFADKLKNLAHSVKTIISTNVPMVDFTRDDWQKFNSATHCHVCEKPFAKDDKRARDHCHLTGRYRGPAHSNYNLNYKDSHCIPVVFHNKNCIQLRFIDSYKFLASNLDKLSSFLTISKDKLRVLQREFSHLSEEDFNLLTRKGIFPYEYIDSVEKLDDTCLPPRESFYSSLTDSTVSESDYKHTQGLKYLALLYVMIAHTYLNIEKSSCFKVLRQSYCIHKGRHLIKPSMYVAPDGYILDIQGPYFSNAANNDAAILLRELETDVNNMRNWFQRGDIFIIDRGYRDAVSTLQRIGLQIEMPSLLYRDQSQLTTEQANNTRIVSKSRWIVEARNGHLKSIFKFFDGSISTSHIFHLRDFLLIAGAIINKFFEPVTMPDATVDLAENMRQRALEPNVVQTRVDVENLRNKRGIVPSYKQDNVLEDREAQFQLDQLNEPGFIRVRIYSRYRNAIRHQLWIAFIEINDEESEPDPILGSYCTFQSRARTLGTCSHVAAVLWFLGYARYQENVKYPPTGLLNAILNADRAADMPIIIG